MENFDVLISATASVIETSVFDTAALPLHPIKVKTMGVAIDGKYAHVWFGSTADPAGYYDVANYQVLHP